MNSRNVFRATYPHDGFVTSPGLSGLRASSGSGARVLSSASSFMSRCFLSETSPVSTGLGTAREGLEFGDRPEYPAASLDRGRTGAEQLRRRDQWGDRGDLRGRHAASRVLRSFLEVDQPNVKQYASTPASRNSISTTRSPTCPDCRTSWYVFCSFTVPRPSESTSLPCAPSRA